MRFPHLIVQPLRCIENTLHSENQRTGFVEKEARNRVGNENQKKAQTFMEKRQNYTRSSLFDKKMGEKWEARSSDLNSNSISALG